MLIVPFAKGMNWKRPPVITIALVIINVLIFSLWQIDDGKKYDQAIHQYLHSSLPKVEFPRYEAFLRDHDRIDEADEVADMRRHTNARPYIILDIQRDPAFLQALEQGEIVKKNEAIHAQWQKDRRAFEEVFDSILGEAYVFKPAMPDITAAFTYMFLHADIMHLVGNMVFLLIVGLVVERMIGSPLYLVAYLSGGLIAAAAFAAGNSDSSGGLLGASGAISAIMGMYAALFGNRKIPFFYSLGFYFDYIRAPAWILLIAWIAKEGYYQLNDHESGIAYLAHFGGLIGGGIMGYLATYFRIVDPKDLEIEEENEEKTPPWQEEYNRAMALLGRMETAKAAQAFGRLHREYPDAADILIQYYKSAKYEPATEAYHQSALTMLSEKGLRLVPMPQIRKVFVEYLSEAKPKPRLNRELLHELGAYFLRLGCLNEAWRVATILIRNDGASERTAGLAVGLARQLRLKKKLDEAGKLLKWVLHQHGDSAMGTQARTLLQVPTKVEKES
jgi:membrane associated rhomboid family serine protease